MIRTQANTPEERMAILARLIVIAKIEMGPSPSGLGRGLPYRPSESDFLGPFRTQLRLELLMVRLDEARKGSHSNDRIAELQEEIIEAEKQIRVMVL